VETDALSDDDFQPTQRSQRPRVNPSTTKKTYAAAAKPPTPATNVPVPPQQPIGQPAGQGAFDPKALFDDLDPTTVRQKVKSDAEAQKVFEWVGMLPTRGSHSPT
jgi:hypothetical protein